MPRTITMEDLTKRQEEQCERLGEAYDKMDDDILCPVVVMSREELLALCPEGTPPIYVEEVSLFPGGLSKRIAILEERLTAKREPGKKRIAELEGRVAELLK